MLFKTVLTTIFCSIIKMKSMFTFYKKLSWLIASLRISIRLIIYIVNYSNWISINTKTHSISSFVLRTFILTFSMCRYISNWKSIFSFFFFISTWTKPTMVISLITFKITNQWMMLTSNRFSHWNMLLDVSLTSLLILFLNVRSSIISFSFNVFFIVSLLLFQSNDILSSIFKKTLLRVSTIVKF